MNDDIWIQFKRHVLKNPKALYHQGLMLALTNKILELKNIEDDETYCAFCGKTSQDVGCVVAGPNAYICDECVEICSIIVGEHQDNKRLRTVQRQVFNELWGGA